MGGGERETSDSNPHVLRIACSKWRLLVSSFVPLVCYYSSMGCCRTACVVTVVYRLPGNLVVHVRCTYRYVLCMYCMYYVYIYTGIYLNTCAYHDLYIYILYYIRHTGILVYKLVRQGTSTSVMLDTDTDSSYESGKYLPTTYPAPLTRPRDATAA